MATGSKVMQKQTKWQQCVDLYNAGMCKSDIAERLHVTRSTVSNYLWRSNNLDRFREMQRKYKQSTYSPTPREDLWKAQDDRKLVKMIESGKTYRETAEKLGKTIGQVAGRINRIRETA